MEEKEDLQRRLAEIESGPSTLACASTLALGVVHAQTGVGSSESEALHLIPGQADDEILCDVAAQGFLSNAISRTKKFMSNVMPQETKDRRQTFGIEFMEAKKEPAASENPPASSPQVAILRGSQRSAQGKSLEDACDLKQFAKYAEVLNVNEMSRVNKGATSAFRKLAKQWDECKKVEGKELDFLKSLSLLHGQALYVKEVPKAPARTGNCALFPLGTDKWLMMRKSNSYVVSKNKALKSQIEVAFKGPVVRNIEDIKESDWEDSFFLKLSPKAAADPELLWLAGSKELLRLPSEDDPEGPRDRENPRNCVAYGSELSKDLLLPGGKRRTKEIVKYSYCIPCLESFGFDERVISTLQLESPRRFQRSKMFRPTHRLYL